MTASAGSPRNALGALAAALVLGVTIVLTAVLPAEYGVDPTGIGQRLGLLQLAGPAPAAAAEAGDEPPAVAASAPGSHVVTLAPDEGIEYKLIMTSGQRLEYRWIASAVVHVDLHGEPEGDTTGYYESYAVSNAREMQGKFSALFDGTHGWYWRNDGEEAVTIDLSFGGQYVGIKDMDAP
ncbi:MAG: hypothetical protein AAF184_02525 [Pseudomonadota bacterium]